ncbi:acyl-CoA--6-aminopenicillanic acid acyltransferase [Bordetella genomosp. 9]|uniref:C45 family autoproteolytic acyltransferase/hydolase n=1 Tax=Bordetella genomosp. 9 TaxID=1416803 RepID=UPI000A295754|nr:C45 family peptidase [Bordetella genomosp. 9]ARP90459.1 acyl-CoA--6-aminopenicillanic acid acyltransferase [Bordetella genomosp. 9]
MSARPVKPFPLYEVSGAPANRGRAYGEQARERIARSIAHYSEQAARWRLARAEIDRIIHSYIPAVKKFDENYLTEMQGIAEGAGVRLEDIFLLNARTEVMKLAFKPELRARLLGESNDGCTSVKVTRQATADGQLIHAQNWDWKEECAETGVVLRILRDDGPDILTFTEAGMLARSGFNSAGISITGNNLESDRDYRQIGVPLPLIRRKALESPYLALALHAVYATPKTGSNNMAVCHREGVAINFECAPDETFLLHPENGLLVHSNHWLSPIALAKLKDTGIAFSPCTLYREQRVRELLTPHVGRITADTVKQALLDDFQTPWSVCRPPRQDFGRDTRSATVSTVVMQPARGLMEVASLPALDPTFTTYELPVRER